MPIQSAEELFIRLLSDTYASESRLLQGMEDLSKVVQDKNIQDVLNVRTYLTKQDVSNIEECFRLLGKEPVKSESRFREVWLEDLRREVTEIQPPALKAIYAIQALQQIQQFHIARYAVLTLMANLAGYMGVATLLEHTMADKMAFVERANDLIREAGREVFVARLRERAA